MEVSDTEDVWAAQTKLYDQIIVGLLIARQNIQYINQAYLFFEIVDTLLSISNRNNTDLFPSQLSKLSVDENYETWLKA